MINLHASFTKSTIEFRLFQFSDPHDGKKGGIHAGEMKAYIQLCLAMSEHAKEVAYASPKPQQTDNEKYAMRCWMLRLGFIGEEFETAREILLRNMDGNAAWRPQGRSSFGTWTATQPGDRPLAKTKAEHTASLAGETRLKAVKGGGRPCQKNTKC